MNWNIIFNPFEKFSEKQLLIFGIILSILGSFLGFYFGVIYDGYLDVHIYEVTLIESLLHNAINILSMFIGLYVLGKIFNSKTRIIDILNAVLIARFPLYILGIFANNQKLNSITDQLIEGINDPQKIQINTADLFFITAFSIFSLVLLVYVIVLLVNGFRTATHAKKWQHFLYFAIALILGEILSKYLIYQF